MMQTCTQCVMDTNGNPEIVFDENGVCNYCYEYIEKSKIRIIPDTERDSRLAELVRNIQLSQKGRTYDCLIGVSGGVDSTYTAYLVKKMGLNPLAVHFDNGWNSELAVHNIQKVLETLAIDLETYVVDWEEFKDIQLSFLRASTPDGEVPTDHAILSTLYSVASKHNIKYIISGNNFKTEGVMPRLWAYGHIDWKYIKSVHRIFGTVDFRTFPRFTILKFIWYTLFRRIKMVSILNYVDYKKDEAMEVLEKELDWKYYGGKHYESNYTKYYQGVILPEKFKIDKRKLHLSALILSKQISRDDALNELRHPIYDETKLAEDTEYLIKKFEITKNEFEEIMNDAPRTYASYPNSFKLHKKLRNILSFLRGKRIVHS